MTPPEAAEESAKKITTSNGTIIEDYRKVSARGGGYEGNNAEGVETGNAKAGSASAGGVSYSGFNVASIQAAADSIRPLYWVAGIAIISGLVIGYFVNWTLGGLLALGGTMIFGLIQYPILAAVAIVVFMIAFGLLLWEMRKGKAATESLSVVKEAVNQSDAKDEIKATVKKLTGEAGPLRDTVKNAIERA